MSEFNEESFRKAIKAIELCGEDGYATAARLIGPNRADGLLADFLSRDCRRKGIQATEQWLIRRVAEVRKARGF